MQRAEALAAAALNARPANGYQALRRAFMFFYFRRLLATDGRVTGAAQQADVQYSVAQKWLKRCPKGLAPAAERALVELASALADDGATSRQARHVFQVAMFSVAVRAARGNRAAAARRLGLHRNSLFKAKFRDILAGVDISLLATGKLQLPKAVA